MELKQNRKSKICADKTKTILISAFANCKKKFQKKTLEEIIAILGNNI